MATEEMEWELRNPIGMTVHRFFLLGIKNANLEVTGFDADELKNILDPDEISLIAKLSPSSN